MKIYYIGSFPPTYGGVTIKNKNLYEALEGKLELRKIDMNRIKRGNLPELLRFGWAMVTGRQYIIGLAGQKNRRQFTKLMYRFKRKAMARSVLLVMSGVVEDVIQAGPDFMNMYSTYRRVFLEFPGMARKLTEAGVITWQAYFPAVITFCEWSHHLRLPTLMGMRRARNAQIRRVTAQELGIKETGLKASPTRVVRIHSRPAGVRPCQKLPVDEVLAALVHKEVLP